MRRVLAFLLAFPLIEPVLASPSPTVATRNLTVKTEQRFLLGRASNVTTVATYFSGTRQRRDTLTSGTLDERVHLVTITLCDANRTLILNPETKLYGYMRHEVPAFRRLVQPIFATPGPSPSGSKVIITIDAVDTGERREVGSYVARHVKTTTTESDGHAEKRVREQDGWYLDLPDMNCGPDGEAMLVATRHDNVHVQHRGTARRGYPIEETDRDDDGNARSSSSQTSRAFISSIAAAPDAAIRSKRPIDTVRNRLESYWEHVVDWSYSLLR